MRKVISALSMMAVMALPAFAGADVTMNHDNPPAGGA